MVRLRSAKRGREKRRRDRGLLIAVLLLLLVVDASSALSVVQASKQLLQIRHGEGRLGQSDWRVSQGDAMANAAECIAIDDDVGNWN